MGAVYYPVTTLRISLLWTILQKSAVPGYVAVVDMHSQLCNNCNNEFGRKISDNTKE